MATQTLLMNRFKIKRDQLELPNLGSFDRYKDEYLKQVLMQLDTVQLQAIATSRAYEALMTGRKPAHITNTEILTAKVFTSNVDCNTIYTSILDGFDADIQNAVSKRLLSSTTMEKLNAIFEAHD